MTKRLCDFCGRDADAPGSLYIPLPPGSQIVGTGGMLALQLRITQGGIERDACRICQLRLLMRAINNQEQNDQTKTP